MDAVCFIFLCYWLYGDDRDDISIPWLITQEKCEKKLFLNQHNQHKSFK